MSNRFEEGLQAALRQAVKDAPKRSAFVRKAELIGGTIGALTVGALAGLLEAKFQFAVPVEHVIAQVTDFIYQTPGTTLPSLGIDLAIVVGAGVPGGIVIGAPLGEKIGKRLYQRKTRRG